MSDLRSTMTAPVAPRPVAPAPVQIVAPDAVTPAYTGMTNTQRFGILPPTKLPVGTVLSERPAQVAELRPAPSQVAPTGTGSGIFGSGSPAAARPPRFGTAAAPENMLYVVADADDAAYRAAIAAFTGGAVDYFDGTAGTPTVAAMMAYDCVYVQPNFQYADRVLLGDNLADYVDAGGQVILGVANTYFFGGNILLGGDIMTPAYNPVTSPGATLTFGPIEPYAGDGVTAYHAGILAYDSFYRDDLVTQGAGIVDGHYTPGGHIALAYRPDGKVVYTNGSGHASFGGGGQWPKLIANACMIDDPAAGAILYAAATTDDPVYRSDIAAITGSVVDYFDATVATPTLVLMATYECVYTHSGGTYFAPVAFGDLLADYVDADPGHKVILGVGATLPGFSLGGRILTPPYSPVTNPVGALHPFGLVPYLGDGTTPIHAGVAFYDAFFREFLVTQGAGKVDGHYTDGEIAQAYRPDGRVVYSNGSGKAGFGTGDWPQLIANICMQDLSSGHKILYAPSQIDDPPYRAAIAAETGGIVDYFDATAATPSAALLASYDCVYTWADAAYDDNVLFGDRLADYVDAGGKVVLGVFCTYTTGNFLSGRIMTPGYCPVVSPAGTNHFAVSAYAGNGTTCLHHRVTWAYSQFFRDFLVPQGDGLIDGRYADGEIAHAYRPDRRVVYSNGGGMAVLGGVATDWARLIANACECRVSGDQMLASNSIGQLFNVDVLTGNGWFIGNLPTFAAGDGATEIEYIADTGTAWLQARDGGFFDQAFSIADASAAGPIVPNGASFQGLEYALSRLWGTSVGAGCGASGLSVLDPVTGVSVAVGATGVEPVAGLAFDGARSNMYGVTSGCAGGTSELYTIDVTTGAAAPVAALPVGLGSLEFGPDGDLYAGGNSVDGGNLYRVNPSTGAVAFVGNPGFSSITGLMLVPAGATGAEGPMATALSLAAPYPNPSGAHNVHLEFTLPKAGSASLELYDVAGRRVWSHDMGSLPAGPHSADWNGLDSSGRLAASGVYFLRLKTNLGEKRVTLVRVQ